MQKLSFVGCLAICLAASSAFGAIAITEVASTSGAPGSLANLDWWELTNTGPTAVSLNGYAWEDAPISSDLGVFPNGITVAVGESIIIHQGAGASVATDFRATWGLLPSVQVLTQSQFTGTNPFSGLSSGGDSVFLFNNLAQQVAGVSFGASTSGVTFEWDGSGANLGLSVAGENGAFTSTYGGVGSPGVAVLPVPEPASGALLAMALCAGASWAIRRRRR